MSAAIALVIAGMSERRHAAEHVQAWTENQALPVVATVSPLAATQGETLNLPAHLQAWNKAHINARVSGYLKSWQVDIGSQVQAGQVLATIDSPELDQQLAQAKAQWLQHKASAALATSTAQRWQHLLATHSVSRQEVDEKVAAAAVAEANVSAAEADYARLKDLSAYKIIRAPFTGTITARHADIGQLIKADTEGATSLFDIADTQRLRLYVPVPQNYASAIVPGMQVELTVPERPGQRYTASLLGSSTSVDSSSGSMLAQYAVENANHALLPGDYASASLRVRSDPHAVSIPSSALIFRAQGPQVAVLDAQNHVHLRGIHIVEDMGSKLILDQGVSLKDLVVDNPPDALRDHDAVKQAEQEVGHAPAV
ncbi:Multidrug resistance protein MdtA precursor [compost metagenome]